MVFGGKLLLRTHNLLKLLYWVIVKLGRLDLKYLAKKSSNALCLMLGCVTDIWNSTEF